MSLANPSALIQSAPLALSLAFSAAVVLHAPSAHAEEATTPAPVATAKAAAKKAAPNPVSTTTPSTPSAPSAQDWKSRPSEAPPRQIIEKGKAEEARPESVPTYEPYGKSKGVAGDFLFGPSITLLGFPSPFKINAEAKYQNVVGAQLSYGFLPKITVSQASGSLKSFDGRVRWFPWRAAMFIGFAYGGQTVTATKSSNATISGVGSVPVTVEGELSNKFSAPHIGWRWTWKSGFFYGMDLGWQLQSGSSTTIRTTSNNPSVTSAMIEASSEYQTLRADVQKTANDLGDRGLPLFTLIQIGWLF